jgi:hypothetical protein
LQEGQYEITVPTITDRVVQAALKLVLEPIFEADFVPCSYGFRPNRRAHDAMAETRFLASKTYEWVLEGDITACLGCMITLLLSLIAVIKTGCLGWWEARYAGLFCVRCGHGRRGVRRA